MKISLTCLRSKRRGKDSRRQIFPSASLEAHKVSFNTKKIELNNRNRVIPCFMYSKSVFKKLNWKFFCFLFFLTELNYVPDATEEHLIICPR